MSRAAEPVGCNHQQTAEHSPAATTASRLTASDRICGAPNIGEQEDTCYSRSNLKIPQDDLAEDLTAEGWLADRVAMTADSSWSGVGRDRIGSPDAAFSSSNSPARQPV